MSEPVVVDVFAEDRAHEALLVPLLLRIAAEEGVAATPRVRTGRGGHRRSIEELKLYQKNERSLKAFMDDLRACLRTLNQGRPLPGEMNRAVWQISGGQASRSYADIFLKQGVPLIGPGDAGAWTPERDDSAFRGHFVRRFAARKAANRSACSTRCCSRAEVGEPMPRTTV
jgi:hypothetical protein